MKPSPRYTVRSRTLLLVVLLVGAAAFLTVSVLRLQDRLDDMMLSSHSMMNMDPGNEKHGM